MTQNEAAWCPSPGASQSRGAVSVVGEPFLDLVDGDIAGASHYVTRVIGCVWVFLVTLVPVRHDPNSQCGHCGRESLLGSLIVWGGLG